MDPLEPFDLRRGAGWFVWLGRGRRVGRWLGRCWAEGSVGGTVCAVATLLGRGLWYICVVYMVIFGAHTCVCRIS